MSDSLLKCWPGRGYAEIAKLRESMPKINGYIMHPMHVPRLKRAAYEAELREWCKRTPKRDWHPMIEDWAKKKAYYDEHNK